ncbi:hypothetical protein AKJ17_18615 [Vibrio nereis]|uniref:PD(D/E)XK endonuclease domain-containing protein n=1 Tax=Vibrio nereis TaxID=693 RepID=A0A0M0HI98_VIBNE|nr:hypothetical protein AKJ17_18615 [Vibrio nereis]
MEFIGKFGEHFVLAELLRRNIESYLAIKSNQENYDITVVLKDLVVKRLQVKSTNLQNDSTNNATDITDKGYDYLVLVVVDVGETKTYIMTKSEVDHIRDNKSKLYVSQKSKEKGCYVVRPSFESHLERWDKIVRT